MVYMRKLLTQKSLDAFQLRNRILDEAIPIDHQELLPRKDLQPAVEVDMVHGDAERSISLVNGAIGKYGQLLKGPANG